MAQKYVNYHVYSPSHHARKPATSRKRKADQSKIKFLVAAAVASFLLGLYFVNVQHTQAIERKAASEEAAQKAQNRQSFVNRVQEIINQNPRVKLSVSAIDLSDGSSVHVGKSGAMNAASCGKVLTAALFLHNVETGSASLSDKLGGYSSRYQLQQLIQQSDDNAWVLFNDELTHSALATYAEQIGLNSYDPDTDFMSSTDLSLLLQKLYSGKLLNAYHTQLLLSFMQNTNYENFISPAVPDSYRIYHKIGFIDTEINDAAIITNGQQKFVLTIFSDNPAAADGSDTLERTELIQKITKAALTYLS
jgi:beta-lactamase class A